MKNLRKISCEEGFMKAKFSLKRKENGEQFTEIEKQKELVGKEIYNSRSQKMETINSNNF